MFPASASQTSLYGPLGFSDVSFGSQNFGAQTLSDTALAARNPQDDFKQSIHVVQQHLARIQGLARSVLAGIEHAYQPGTNPIQTAAEAESLRQMLLELTEYLRQTGVGALPLLDPVNPIAALPTEEKLLEDTTKSIEAEYAKHQRMQESAGTVVNLLTAVDQSLRK